MGWLIGLLAADAEDGDRLGGLLCAPVLVVLLDPLSF
jgi:hypothetical protein